MKRLLCILLALICMILSACQVAPGANLDSESESQLSDSAVKLSEQEYSMVLTTMFSNYIISDVHWNTGDIMFEIIEFWKDGELIESSELFLNEPHFGEPEPLGWSQKMIYGVQDNLLTSSLDYDDRIQFHAIILAGGGTTGSDRVKRFPANLDGIGFRGNVYDFPANGLSKGESVLLLEQLYLGDSTPAESSIENAMYGIRVYLKNSETMPTATPAIEEPALPIEPTPDAAVLPDGTMEDAILGEWAGYISMDSDGEYIYSNEETYAAKLTLSADGALLTWDKLQVEFDYTNYLSNPIETGSARMSVENMESPFVTLKADKSIYGAFKGAPFSEDGTMELTYYPLRTEISRRSDIASLTPAYYSGASNDMLYGSLNDGERNWNVSLARLSEAVEDGFYPRWEPGFSGLIPNVRGAYTFGERGADNDNSTHIFVFSDSTGAERIRIGHGTFYGKLGNTSMETFIISEPMFEFSLSMASMIYWYTPYTIDTQSGVFVDVSKQYPDFYRDYVVPLYEEMLSGAKASANEDYDYAEEIKAYTEALGRAKKLAK